AQRVTRRRPDRLQGRRAHAAFGNHRVETGQMRLFLRQHAADLGRMLRPAAHHRQLPGIDAGRAIFTGLVDPDHRFARIAHLPMSFFSSSSIAMAAAVEIRKLKPASEMPARLHCTSSQRTSGAAKIASSASPPPTAVAQVVSPSHQPYSTPAWYPPI